MNFASLFQIADIAAGSGEPATSTVVISLPTIVFMLLAVLVIVLIMFGRASRRAEAAKKHLTQHEKDLRDGTVNGKKPKKRKFAEPAPAPAAPQGVTPEVVAAISAAVYMLEGEGAVVKSIRPLRKNPISNRNPWAAAAVAENTKPF